ncbi:tRNA (guanosine(37)-N1)-methyltransferase TrmD [Candidatus Phytoplasma phoenicium]|uniref:tRNA (guanine-N(1)-)-methyltransferase n=1 Tax=Candidatus Phytoplasma phoenicium TaxID=198422 RepID=A0A0L0MJ86_9MOLU|nr:tRNA (guanosine(37)-N1)-methyltransferase TrmD [Candidatus Phytoplasma phoenicium]KND62707.1 tRNA (Guanine37-N1) -methyltransferase [Candidatus Phytoplasma phoenicium]
MKFDIITIFPNFFENFLNHSIVKRAQAKKKITINIHDLRTYSQNKHRKIDDVPYGGDIGMLLAFPPFYECLQNIPKETKSKVILLSPQGHLLQQSKVFHYAKEYIHLIVLCGHYEGVDARILNYIDEEVSIGDYVLTGGEIASTVLIDAVTRLIPGVIKKESYLQDSLQHNLLKYPQYTRPRNYKNHSVPDILLTGHHQKISKWKKEESLKNTFLKRPDFLKKIDFDENTLHLLEKIKKEKLI